VHAKNGAVGQEKNPPIWGLFWKQSMLAQTFKIHLLNTFKEHALSRGSLEVGERHCGDHEMLKRIVGNFHGDQDDLHDQNQT
jgi:hypothetical protein